jgi:hypothetical protein
MARIEISDATFTIDDKNVKPYFDEEIVSYSNMHTTKTRLEEKLKENPNKNQNDIYALKWIESKLEKTSKEIYNKNESRRPVSGDTPHKTRKDTNPPKIGGSVYDSLMKESLEKEIKEIKYLIEYMTNNNKNNLI